eukprot:scaffold2519_cov108-Isochrysis_galbana.AAC.7
MTDPPTDDTEDRSPGARRSRPDRRRLTPTSPRPRRRRASRQGTLRHIVVSHCDKAKNSFFTQYHTNTCSASSQAAQKGISSQKDQNITAQTRTQENAKAKTGAGAVTVKGTWSVCCMGARAATPRTGEEAGYVNTMSEVSNIS